MNPLAPQSSPVSLVAETVPSRCKSASLTAWHKPRLTPTPGAEQLELLADAEAAQPARFIAFLVQIGN
jgi:hypothetical protein